jgi:hypothetical protein
MLLPSSKAVRSPLKKLLDFVEPIHQYVKDLAGRLRLPRGFNPRPHELSRRGTPGLCLRPIFQPLEARLLLYSNPVANNDSYMMPYYAWSSVSAPGVLANDTDPCRLCRNDYVLAA